MADTTTSSVSNAIGSEWIEPMIQETSKARAVIAPFTKQVDLRGRGTSTAQLNVEDSNVGSESDIDGFDQSEGTDIDTTEFTTTSVNFGVSEYGIRRKVTDATLEDNALGGELLDYLVESAAEDLAIVFDDDLAALFTSFSTSVGATGDTLDVELLTEAFATLEATGLSRPGGAVFILGSQQQSDLFASAQSSGGTLMADFVNISPDQSGTTGRLGSVLAQEVYSTSLVDTINTGADEAGALMIRGDAASSRSAAIATSTARDVTVRNQYVPESRATNMVATMRRGNSENVGDAAVQIVSRASA